MTQLIKEMFAALLLSSLALQGEAYGFGNQTPANGQSVLIPACQGGSWESACQNRNSSVTCLSTLGSSQKEASASCNSRPGIFCGNMFIAVDFLYWRAYEGGLDICVPHETHDSVTSDYHFISQFSGRGHDLHFNWHPAFRLSAGYEFPCSPWGVMASWTHYYGHDKGRKEHEHPLHWHLNFDTIDVVAGYEVAINNCFMLLPYFGVRGAEIDQKVKSGEFCHHHRTCHSDNLLQGSKNHNKERFAGAGPIIGLEVDWKLGCDFSFYVSADTAWLYGNFNVHLNEINMFAHATSFCRVKKHLQANLAAADAALGIRWKHCFCNNLRMMFQLGLEHHRYFDFNRIGCYGDLSFDGVNFSASFLF